MYNRCALVKGGACGQQVGDVPARGGSVSVCGARSAAHSYKAAMSARAVGHHCPAARRALPSRDHSSPADSPDLRLPNPHPCPPLPPLRPPPHRVRAGMATATVIANAPNAGPWPTFLAPRAPRLLGNCPPRRPSPDQRRDASAGATASRSRWGHVRMRARTSAPRASLRHASLRRASLRSCPRNSSRLHRTARSSPGMSALHRLGTRTMLPPPLLRAHAHVRNLPKPRAGGRRTMRGGTSCLQHVAPIRARLAAARTRRPAVVGRWSRSSSCLRLHHGDKARSSAPSHPPCGRGTSYAMSTRPSSILC